MSRKLFWGYYLLLVSLVPGRLTAQLCQGSLGDPVVNITFGSGPNPGPPLGAGITNYNYVANSCPDDGSYSLASAILGCYQRWVDVPKDHTGDVNGYMMVINASVQPGIFYTQTVNGLCENTTYEFAAWVMNLYSKALSCQDPNITFSIETTSGTVLQSYQTGSILPAIHPEWKQYGLFFSTPPGTTSVVIKMVNNEPGGCGNDFVMDDITFRPCGPLVAASINGHSDSVKVCLGDSSIFTFASSVSAGYTHPSLQWEVSTDSGRTWTDIPGANSPSYTRAPIFIPGLYQYRVAVSNGNNISCRIQSGVLTINVVKENPKANAGPDQAIVRGQSTVLNGIAGDSDYTFWWTPDLYMSSAVILTPRVTPPADMEYTLHVKSNAGCGSVTDSVLITVYKDIFIPTAFTPNGDGINDAWTIKTLALYPKAEVNVFNRWGGLVYTNNGHGCIWDGTCKGVSQPADVYGYVIDLKNGMKVLRGTVTLIR